MTEHKEISAVVFDFGGVLTTTTMPERVRPLVAELGVPWSALEEGFAKYRKLMDGGYMDYNEMYSKIWADAGVTVDAETQAKILAEDVASYLYGNARTVKWMAALKAAGYGIGILTNMCTEFADKFREHFPECIALADAMVISGEEHLYKPQKEIFDLMASRFGLPADRLLFVDDLAENCNGARAAGWKAIRFVSNDQVESDFMHGLWK